MSRIDCVSLVPSIFSSLDVTKLVSLCPSVQRAEKVNFILTDLCYSFFLDVINILLIAGI